jgi:hypothetical protein
MPAITYPDSTLGQIKTKVRRLTHCLSTDQLTEDDLNQYINTFIIYDLPEHVRLFNLRKKYAFYTQPYQDVYPTNTIAFAGVTTNPLYDFQNTYITVHPPFYVAGYDTYFTQSREQFYGMYPLTNTISPLGITGDGMETNFVGIINAQNPSQPSSQNQPLVGFIQGEVTFTGIATNGQGLVMVDVPIVDTTTGNKTLFGNLYVPGTQPVLPPTGPVITGNWVNYATGAFSVTFPAAPAPGSTINAQAIARPVSLPLAICFFNDSFILRPAPDKVYKVEFECYVKPIYLMEDDQSPQLKEWWQWIAYGASKKVLEDRMEMELVANILPEYDKQMRLCLRRTLVQLGGDNMQAPTIYGNGSGGGNGIGSNAFNGSGWGW